VNKDQQQENHAISLPAALFERYLSILGIQRRLPGMEALRELVAAQMMRVPFENISKLYYRKHNHPHSLQSLEMYLDGIDQHNFGGTCYANNYYLHLLLVHLGYQVKLCGADMNNPDVHLVNMVTVDGHEYIVDVGYAAPFLKPLPRDLKEDYEIRLGNERYLLKPQDGKGRSCLEQYRDGELRHGYTVKPVPRQIGFFADVIAHSFTDDATFMNALLLVRFFPDSSVMINNLTLIKSRGSKSEIIKLADRNELIGMIEKHFSISRNIVTEAVAEIDEMGDAWS
jgi:arylamine N-acetyltransferase